MSKKSGHSSPWSCKLHLLPTLLEIILILLYLKPIYIHENQMLVSLGAFALILLNEKARPKQQNTENQNLV